MQTIDNKTNNSFVHLHVHSHYSLLDGMSSIPGLVNKAIHDGMQALALTDHGNMFGVKEFYDYVQKKNKGKEAHERFKPILGVEAYCARRSLKYNNAHPERTKEDIGGWHLILLAKNRKGYQNLCKMVSISWIEGFYNKPRIDRELLEQYHEGIIACSACLGGEVPQKLMGGKYQVDDDVQPVTDSFGDASVSVSEKQMADAEKSIAWFKRVFGDDFYLELQRHRTDKPGGEQDVYRKQMAIMPAMLDLAKKTNTKYICTNDVHFVEEEHCDAHDRLICLSTGRDLDDPKRMHYTKQEWFKTQDEMAAVFSDLPEALANTVEIAGKVEYYSIDSEPLMPDFPLPEGFTDADEYLKYLTLRGTKQRYGEQPEDSVLERIEFELETIRKMGFPGYFLIVQDFIRAAREMGVSVGPGRGSAAGSAVAYCLGITDIDPLKYDLLFERFLNPDRISMPDIDIDFDDDGRADVLRWVMEKYGKEKVAHIITYGTMAAKSSIKDVARVQGLPLSEAERLTKLIPDRLPEDRNGNTPKINIANSIQYVPELKEARYSNDKNLSDTLKYAEMLEGTVRQVGVHACGVIIGADDLTNFVPLSTAKEKGSDEDVLVTQYEGSVIESIGLIKMDFLGLKTLSIIKEALSNIKKSKGLTIDISRIPIDDEKTYELYSKGQTIGTFQFESAGMQKYLRELKPTKFEDLIAMNALYRPGPMAYIPDFIERKHGRRDITYDFPEMESRLKDTYGITVYQEQVMLLSRDLAGFTRGQSDELRKAMGKKLIDKMEAMHAKFIDGATAKGFGPNEKLEKIWADWVEFAKYAFNKSHATCYSWVSYQTAYLKAHYPAEFMSANLTRNKDDIGEITKFMDECRSMGITVKGPDVNESELNFTVNKEGNIRFGLGGVKGVGTSAVEAIIREREENGAFKNIFDFVERVNLTACNKKNMEALCYSGAFDAFQDIRREQFFATNSKGDVVLETLIRHGNKYQTEKSSSMLSLFGDFNAVDIARPEIPRAESWSNIERLNKEKDLVGIYLSSHPLDDYYLILNYICNTGLADLDAAKKASSINKELIIGGIVTSFKQGSTKTGNPYGILKLEDFTGSGEIPLFGKDYIEYGKYGIPNMYLLIKGKYQPRQYKETILDFRISSIHPLPEIKNSIVNKISISLSLNQLDEKIIAELSSMIKNNPGNCAFYFKIEDREKQLSVSLYAETQKYAIDKNLVHFLEDNQIKFSINS
ncbi:DNA-directed DNA polymerase [Bacteroidia bacterium]|nr:DNA-directed DNA polymerase [Bacteroidia bacterium]GHT62107.1 DNA-directed DNA polymerase [Bacteroidia bacterium]